MRGPQRFDPEAYSHRARSFYGGLDLDPSHGAIIIGRRKVPALHHSYAEDVNMPEYAADADFSIPTEYGTPTNVDFVKMEASPVPNVFIHSPVTNSRNELIFHRQGSALGIPYEGPEHLNELLNKHHHELGSGIMSGQFKVGSGTRAWQDHILDIHRRTDPEYPIEAWHAGELGPFAEARGWLSPRQGFKYRGGHERT